MAKETPVVVTEREERRFRHEALEYRESEEIAQISGYAAVFNQETVIGGMFGFREQIDPHAFDDAIKVDDVRALFNHNPDILLGRTESGTLTLSVDKRGLKYTIDLPNTAAARDVRELIRRGDVTGSSFGFTVDEDEWDESEMKKGKLPLRTLTKVSLFDVSPVTYPAYPQTSVSARSKAQAITETVEQAKEASEAAKPAAVKEREAMRARLDAAKAWAS